LIRLSDFAEVVAIYEVHQLGPVLLLDHMHLWKEEAVGRRFHHERPGISVLLARIYRMASPTEVRDDPRRGGGWVDLGQAYATKGGTPVLSDADFRHLQRTVEGILRPTALA
jgi:hypothetical protein